MIKISNYTNFPASLRIKKDNKIVLNKLNSEKNVNQYLINLIVKDIYENRRYNFINNDIEINFDVNKVMNDLIANAEEADLLNDYGLYMNYVYAIDAEAKKEVSNHIISESNWNRLLRRYTL